MINYSQICFVIMPFGKNPVSGADVNFDWIYDTIFLPAISAVDLPEGGKLDPRRTDRDFFTADISLEMFRYLEYSRFAVADITGLNANVFYELGVRHHARESGTAIFRQANATIPFDIRSIKVFPYEYEPAEKVEEAHDLIRKVLGASLVHNRLDSPVRIYLDLQRQQRDALQERLRDAENAIRRMDANAAMQIYKEVVKVDPTNPLHHIKLGMVQKDQGLWAEAIHEFDIAINLDDRMDAAWREKGKLASDIAAEAIAPAMYPAPGEADLRRAIELNEYDFDAQASLGSVLKRAKRYDEAWQWYDRACEISGSHARTVLDEIKLRTFHTKKLDLTDKNRQALKQFEYILKTDVSENPPRDAPWCFFNLAEISLYHGKADEFVKLVDQGIETSRAKWQSGTFLEDLRLLEPAAQSLPGLKNVIDRLK